MSSKGYVVAVCQELDDPYICGVLHVERDGVKLLYGIPYVEDGVYLDTPANRRLLADYSMIMEGLVLIRKTVHREHER